MHASNVPRAHPTGAREQIANRLKERKDIVWAEPMEKSIQDASLYVAKLTFSSLGDVFKGSRRRSLFSHLYIS
jgi:hypothetical protein